MANDFFRFPKTNVEGSVYDRLMYGKRHFINESGARATALDKEALHMQRSRVKSKAHLGG
jgi:hypothetical protein